MENQSTNTPNTTATPNTPKPKTKLVLLLSVVVIAVLVVVFAALKLTDSKKTEPEVITVSTLERIVNVNELSTFTAVYNGIAQVMNPQKPEETNYYVSYEARVDAGINFEDIVFSVDNETKSINVCVPEVFITDINVDMSSLEFIFCNDKANKSTVSEEAFKACEKDVLTESEQQTAIYELARQNAINVLTALINPIVEQLDAEYTLMFE